MAKLLLICSLMVCIFVTKRVNCATIRFYSDYRFTDQVYESSLNASCNNVNNETEDMMIKSIKADACFMVYKSPNCKSLSDKSGLDFSLLWGIKAGSYVFCNENIGGTQLNVDITKWYAEFGDTEDPDVLESYRNICTCINIPKNVQNMTRWSVNNYGNEFLAYFEPNCSQNEWKSVRVRAGHRYPGAPSMHAYEIQDIVTSAFYKIQSIGPDPESTYFKTSCSAVEKQTNPTHIIEQPIVADNFSTAVYEKVSDKFSEPEKTTESYRTSTEALPQHMGIQLQTLANKVIELESKFEMYHNLSEKLTSLENSVRDLVEMIENCNPLCAS